LRKFFVAIAYVLCHQTEMKEIRVRRTLLIH